MIGQERGVGLDRMMGKIGLDGRPSTRGGNYYNLRRGMFFDIYQPVRDIAHDPQWTRKEIGSLSY
jgi:hypothetical protein